MLCKKALFFSATCVCILCVCVLFFSRTPKAKTQNLFFLLGVGGDIICKRDRWWVYWLLIIYALLLPWQFSTLIYIFSRNVEIFIFFFPQVTKKFWKKVLNIEENSIWLKWFFYLFIYLTNIGSTCQGITIYDIIIRWRITLSPPPPKTIWGVSYKKSTYSKFFF